MTEVEKLANDWLVRYDDVVAERDALRAEVAARNAQVLRDGVRLSWLRRRVKGLRRDLATARELLARCRNYDCATHAELDALLDPRRDEARGVKRCRWCAGAGCMGCQPRDEARK